MDDNEKLLEDLQKDIVTILEKRVGDDEECMIYDESNNEISYNKSQDQIHIDIRYTEGKWHFNLNELFIVIII